MTTLHNWLALALYLAPIAMIGLSMPRLRGRWLVAAITLLCLVIPFTAIDIFLLTTTPNTFYCGLISFCCSGVTWQFSCSYTSHFPRRKGTPIRLELDLDTLERFVRSHSCLRNLPLLLASWTSTAA